MRNGPHVAGIGTVLLLALAIGCLAAGAARADGKVMLYGARLEPNNDDAEEYSRAGWGGGLSVVVPMPQLAQVLAGVFGLEFVNLMRETSVRRDRVLLLRTEVTTSQNYGRLYLGGELGGHSRGFLRPHAGLNLALVYYDISTTVTIPDDINPDNSLVQDLGGDSNLRFGYDLTLGVDLNPGNTWNLDLGVRYVKSFGVPQQLSDRNAITIHPDYFQIYLGVGASFGFMKKS